MAAARTLAHSPATEPQVLRAAQCTEITFRVPRRSPDRVSQALVVLAPVAGPYGYKKYLQLVKGDTIVTVRATQPLPADELRRLYTALRRWCSAVEVVDQDGVPAAAVSADFDD